MAGCVIDIFNPTNEIMTYSYQEFTTEMWNYNYELAAGQRKRLWTVRNTFSTAYSFTMVVDEDCQFPFTPTNSRTSTPTPTQSPTSTLL